MENEASKTDTQLGSLFLSHNICVRGKCHLKINIIKINIY